MPFDNSNCRNCLSVSEIKRALALNTQENILTSIKPNIGTTSFIQDKNINTVLNFFLYVRHIWRFSVMCHGIWRLLIIVSPFLMIWVVYLYGRICDKICHFLANIQKDLWILIPNHSNELSKFDSIFFLPLDFKRSFK